MSPLRILTAVQQIRHENGVRLLSINNSLEWRGGRGRGKLFTIVKIIPVHRLPIKIGTFRLAIWTTRKTALRLESAYKIIRWKFQVSTVFISFTELQRKLTLTKIVYYYAVFGLFLHYWLHYIYEILYLKKKKEKNDLLNAPTVQIQNSTRKSLYIYWSAPDFSGQKVVYRHIKIKSHVTYSKTNLHIPRHDQNTTKKKTTKQISSDVSYSSIIQTSVS